MPDAESLRVAGSGERWRIEGRWRAADRQLCNDYLGYLADRRYSPASVRAYAFDLLHFARWLTSEGAGLDAVDTDSLLRYLAACRIAIVGEHREGDEFHRLRGGQVRRLPPCVLRDAGQKIRGSQMRARTHADVDQCPGPHQRRDQFGEPGQRRVVQQVEGVAAGNKDQPCASQLRSNCLPGCTSQRQRRDPETHARQAAHLFPDVFLLVQHVSRRRHVDGGRVARVAIKQPGQAVETLGPEDHSLHDRNIPDCKRQNGNAQVSAAPAATGTKDLVQDPQPTGAA